MKKYSAPAILFFGLALATGAIWFAQTSTSAQNSSRIPINAPIDTPTAPLRVAPPIWPPRPMPPFPPLPPIDVMRQVELQFVSQRAVVDINAQTARTKLTQVFKNPTSRTIEGTYLFPLPTGAAVTGFAMTVNGKRVAAEILDSDKARGIYEGIVSKLRDPAILEFADRNTLRARIFPIATGAEQTMEIEYSQSLSTSNNAWKYGLPQRLPIGGAPQKSSIEVRIRPRQNARGVYSPSHQIENKIDGDALRVTGEWTNDQTSNANEARDFTLYGTQSQNGVGVNVWTQNVAGEDAYFMLLAAPDPNLNATEIAAKDVVFCFDTSGSMSGEKIEQARRALLNLLGNLNALDRFNIVTFSSDVNPFRDGLVNANAANIGAAKTFAQNIKAVGGTNIDEALQTSLKMLSSSTRSAASSTERAQQLVFMTDGQPTVGETDIDTILKNARDQNLAPSIKTDKPGVWTKDILQPKARLFAFGVGFDVNTKLLDALGEENGGASDYVLPNENIETVVGSLYSKIAFPAMSNLNLNWNGANVYDVYPKTLPALFKGNTTVVFGRIKNATSSTRVDLSGVVNGKSVTINGQIAGDKTDDNDSIPRLWATRKVGFLLDDSRRKGVAPVGEVREEIIALSKKFGIVTPLTAALITEDEAPRPTPPFWRDDAIGGTTGGISRNAPRSQADNTFGTSSGESAVRAAKSTTRMKSSTRLEASVDVKNVAGKTFVLKNDVWMDTLFDVQKKLQTENVKFASPRYFELARNAQVAKWLSVGQRVIIVLNNRVIKVEP